MARSILVFVLAAAHLTAAARAEGRKKPEPANPPGVLFERNLEYSSPAKGPSLQLDVAWPARAKKPCPAVVLIPGGTWLGGRREGTRPLQFALAARGFVAVSIDYRQNPDQPFPCQLNDAKCAVRWLRAKAARLGIDKERVAAVGYSAGGNVACMLGLTRPADRLEETGGNRDQPSGVQAVATFGGVSDLTRLYEDHCLAKPWTPWKGYLRYCIEVYMGGPPARCKDAYKKASAISYARKGGAPMLLIHGTADTLVPPSQSRRLAAKLKRAGAVVNLEEIEEGGHFLEGAHEQAAHEVLFKFLDRHLRRAE